MTKIDEIIEKINRFEGVNDKITFKTDVEKMKHVIGYINSQGIVSSVVIQLMMFFADMLMLETSNRTLYGEMYIAARNERFFTVTGIELGEYLKDKENIELHEDYNLDYLSGSDIAALNEEIEIFKNFNLDEYIKMIKENKYTKIINQEMGDKDYYFVRWEPLIKDFPDEKQNWLKDFYEAIVY